MKEYFKTDFIRTKTTFEESLLFKHKNYKDDSWLRGLTYSVFHLYIDKLMVKVKLMKDWDANKLYEVCVCKMNESMGLPHLHQINQYVDGVVPFENVDSFSKQLSFEPFPIEDPD